MSTLLRDVIDIPERAGAEDYVLRLTDSVGHEAAQRDASTSTSSPTPSPRRSTRPSGWSRGGRLGRQPRRVPHRLVRLR